MNLDNANQWLTLLANLGVIAGIIFLGLEIQQNTRTMQATAIQESTNVAREQIMMFATDAETNRIAMMGRDSPASLTAEERQRYSWIIRSFWLGMQGLYRQWEMEILPDEEWSVWTITICQNKSGGGEESWQVNRQNLIPAFVDWVEESCDAINTN